MLRKECLRKGSTEGADQHIHFKDDMCQVYQSSLALKFNDHSLQDKGRGEMDRRLEVGWEERTRVNHVV